MKAFVPVPGQKIEEKYRWFYKPYAYPANIAKYMDFDSDAPSENEFDDYNYSAFPELECSPWTLEREENKEIHSKYI